MLNSKSALLVSLLLATQLASAGGLVIEKQTTPPFDESLNGSVILENQADNGGVVLEKGIIVQEKLAGAVIIEKAAEIKDEGGVILERGGIKLLSGGMVIERGIIVQKGVQKNQLAGGLIIDRRGNGLIAESLTA